ncbi:MAG: peptidylprolyl isomerase [Planctomycetota bacterium]|nr:peptidylprolyl isomerase [Planctomycetota bacterium]
MRSSASHQNHFHLPGNRPRRVMLLLGSGCLILGVCLLMRWSAGSKVAQARSRPSAKSNQSNEVLADASVRQWVATVNGKTISRQHLAEECLREHGEGVLETVMNRHLIALECQKQNIRISEEEIDSEIDRVSRRFGLPVDQWLTLLQNERDIPADRYRQEIIWPTVALRRLARKQLAVSDDEIQREIESQFGPQVQVRMIVLSDRQHAEKIRGAAMADPESFASLAVKHSIDINSASSGGLVQPIRRHIGEPEIEAVAFSLQVDQVSDVIAVGDQYVVMQCVAQLPAKFPSDAELQQIRNAITESIRDRKLHKAGTELFQALQEQANVKNVLNDENLRRSMPGVAATINGHSITTDELAEACISRHGKEVLSGLINRQLIEMEVSRSGVQISKLDLDQEVTRAAQAAGVTDQQGNVDFVKWYAIMQEQQNVSQAMYLDKIVWPSVALRKLVASEVQVTDEDLQKAYDANYGPRVRCRAIVMDNLRRAQEVWGMYRARPTVENFAELASQYSIDPGGKSLGGVVPPIQRHGGQPALEKEAFRLKKGEHSGVIQVGDKFIFLLCEGVTKPVEVDPEEVQDVLHADILEKKHRIMMSRRFEQILEQASIQNMLYPELSRTPASKIKKLNARSSAADNRG